MGKRARAGKRAGERAQARAGERAGGREREQAGERERNSKHESTNTQVKKRESKRQRGECGRGRGQEQPGLVDGGARMM